MLTNQSSKQNFGGSHFYCICINTQSLNKFDYIAQPKRTIEFSKETIKIMNYIQHVNQVIWNLGTVTDTTMMTNHKPIPLI